MSYEANPDNNKKMSPKSKPYNDYGYTSRATTPPVNIIQERPNHVIINLNGIYAFTYQTSCSLGGTNADVGTYTTGSVVDDAGGPVRLDINPVAWRQTDAAGTVGDVTFVYTGDIG